MNKSVEKIGPSEIVMLICFTILSFVLVLIPIEGDAKRALLYYVVVIPHLICMSLLTWWGLFCYFQYQKALDLIKSVDPKAINVVLSKEATALEHSFNQEMLAVKNYEHTKFDNESGVDSKNELRKAWKAVRLSKSRFWGFHTVASNAWHNVHPSYKKYL